MLGFALEETRLGRSMGRVAFSAVSKIIGESGAMALAFSVDYELLSRDPVKFDGMLRRVFSSGSRVIENTIVDELYSTSGLRRSGRDSDFADAVLRFALLARGR